MKAKNLLIPRKIIKHIKLTKCKRPYLKLWKINWLYKRENYIGFIILRFKYEILKIDRKIKLKKFIIWI